MKKKNGKPGLIYRIVRKILRPYIIDISLRDIKIFGDVSRLRLAPTANLCNALCNTISGTITIRDYVFCGHNVSLITGTHDYQLEMGMRQKGIKDTGNDIMIEEGVWIGSNVTILGPCTIGRHAVIAAGAVVRKNVSEYSIAAGIPAKIIKKLN